jgi:4-aminobutyrate aminotransferase-like enzyme
MGMINAFDPSKGEGLDADEQALIERRQRILGPAYRLFYQHPLHVVRSEGVWLYDKQGRKYLDAYNNVACVGHCHPHVVEAVSRQLATLNTHTRYLGDEVLAYAERLLELFPRELERVMFTCTGSEANDLAIRVAKSATGGTGIIATRLAYHGVTETVAGFSPSLGPNVARGADVYLVDAPVSAAATATPSEVGSRFASGVRKALSRMREAGVKPAAIIVDTIFSSDGVFSDPPGFLAEAVNAIQAEGGLFIADEVQAGFARTGEAFWGFTRHGLIPDIVTMGKPMGNGYPVAAMVTRDDVLADFGAKSRYFNTFGGSSAAMAAAGAVLDIIEAEGLMENAAETGMSLRKAIEGLSKKYPIIAEVRGAGMFIGVELKKPDAGSQPATEETTRIVNGLRERGVLISASGPHANVLKIRPPLAFRPPEVRVFMEAFEETLRATT